MRAPIPLLSAMGFLVAAGAIVSRPTLVDGALGLGCVLAAVAMLRDRDRQLANEIIDGTLGLIHSAARPAGKGERL